MHIFRGHSVRSEAASRAAADGLYVQYDFLCHTIWIRCCDTENNEESQMFSNWRSSALYASLRPYVPNALRRIVAGAKRFYVAQFKVEHVIDFRRFKMRVSNREHGGLAHESMYWHELASPLAVEIVKYLEPQLFVDVGANYGFASLLQHANQPSTKIIAIEPNPALVRYVEENLRVAGCHDFQVLHAVCGKHHAAPVSFAVNGKYSQDSRVVGPASWKRVQVPVVALDEVLLEQWAGRPVFIKIDTQGYEQHVLDGAYEFLMSSAKWMMKIEFGPHWLESQGTSAEYFLQNLVDRFNVAELPSRIRFRGDELSALMRHPLALSDCVDFDAFVRDLATGGDGYCDLLVWPRSSVLREITQPSPP